MYFTRMIVKNVEKATKFEAKRFIYMVTSPFTHTENTNSNRFCVKHIQLLNNGWVEVTHYDETGIEMMPSWRVTSLEKDGD